MWCFIALNCNYIARCVNVHCLTEWWFVVFDWCSKVLLWLAANKYLYTNWRWQFFKLIEELLLDDQRLRKTTHRFRELMIFVAFSLFWNTQTQTVVCFWIYKIHDTSSLTMLYMFLKFSALKRSRIFWHQFIQSNLCSSVKRCGMGISFFTFKIVWIDGISEDGGFLLYRHLISDARYNPVWKT